MMMETNLKETMTIFTTTTKKLQIDNRCHKNKIMMNLMTLNLTRKVYSQICQGSIAILKVKVRMFIHLSVSKIASTIARCIHRKRSLTKETEKQNCIEKNLLAGFMGEK